MIEEPPLLTVRRQFERADSEAIAAATEAPSCHIVDAIGGRGALDHHIKPVAPHVPAMCRFVGTAMTCHAGSCDNLAVYGAIAMAQPRDVLIVATDAFEATSVTGDLVIGMARNRGISAFVTDGMVRDVKDLIGVGLPVFCRGVTPNSPARRGPGSVGLPVTLGGVTVEPGDLVMGDGEGVVIVPRALAAGLPAALAEVRKAEAAMLAQVQAGLEVPEHTRTLLDGPQTRYID